MGWKEEYFRLGFNLSATIDDIEKATKLKGQHLPEKIYKYCPLNDWSIKNIENNTFFLSPIKLLNDISECACFIDYKSIKINDLIFSSGTLQLKEQLRMAKANFQQKPTKRNEFLLKVVRNRFLENAQKDFKHNLFKDFLIGSFTENNDNILMWAHYADNHKGICIEYDMSDIFATWKESLAFLHPVQYKTKLFDFTEICLANNLGKAINPYCIVMPALIKNIAWSYENEWRLILTKEFQNQGLSMLFQEIDNGGMLINMPKPSAIYKGERFDNNSKNSTMLNSLCKSQKIDISEMATSNLEYKMESMVDAEIKLYFGNNAFTVNKI